MLNDPVKVRERRAALRKQGLCVRCRAKNDRPGKYYCSRCAERIKKFVSNQKARRSQSGLCVICGRNKTAGKRCEYCRVTAGGNPESCKRRRGKLRDEGRCLRCGVSKGEIHKSYCKPNRAGRVFE